MNAALSGIAVLDVTQQLPGPYATMLLQQLGARVIKIEPPGGEAARALDMPMFEALNAGKELRELDLRSAHDQAQLRALCTECDVFVEGFRPGVVERLGASYEILSGVRADLVYCSLSGYGQTGPYRGLAGHDINYLGVGGGVREDDETTRRIGVPMIDLAAGTTAALAILAALRRRDRDGIGEHLDIAMLDVAVVWANLKPQTWIAAPGYGVFRAADGAALSLAALEDKFWRNLCDALGWEGWKDEFAAYPVRTANADAIAQRLATDLLGRSRDEWLELFAAADVPVAPVHATEDMRRDLQVVERELFVDGGHVRAPLPPQLRGWIETASDSARHPIEGGESMTDFKQWARDEVKGLWASPLTPFLEDGSIDHEGIRHNVDYLIEVGADGIGFGFSEPWVMTIAERHEAIETFVEAAKGRVKAYVHITDHSTKETIEFGRHAARLGADAVMGWVPFEWAKTQGMMADFYEHVCPEIPLPVFAYNTPHSGRLMTAETLDRVADIPNLVALKNAVNSFGTSLALHKLLDSRMVVSDPLESNYPLAITQLDQQVVLGTTSVYLMQSKEWQPVRDYAEAFRRGAIDEGWKIYHSLDPIRLFWQRMYDVLWSEAGALHPLAKLKLWMDEIGMTGGSLRPPMHSVPEEEAQAFLAELRSLPPMQKLYPTAATAR